MNIAKLIALIEQQSEQIAIVLSAFRDKQITSEEVVRFIVELLERSLMDFCKKDEVCICVTAQ